MDPSAPAVAQGNAMASACAAIAFWVEHCDEAYAAISGYSLEAAGEKGDAGRDQQDADRLLDPAKPYSTAF